MGNSEYYPIVFPDGFKAKEKARMLKEAEDVLVSSALESIGFKSTDSSENSPLESGPQISLDLNKEPKLFQEGQIGRVEARLADGRDINIMTRSFGPEGGWPILWGHGMPGSATTDLYGQHIRDLHLSGIRRIGFDRGGYGLSTRLKGRNVADSAVIIQAILKAYKIKQCSVAGRSGGGPSALAGVALLDEVVNAAAFGSRAPNNANIDRSSGEIRNEILLALADEAELVESFRSTSGKNIVEHPSRVLKAIMPHLSPSDKKFVLQPQIRRMLIASHVGGLEYGPEGRIDDVMSLRKDWGFPISAIGDKRVYFIQGIEGDKYTPAEHLYHLLNQIRNSRQIITDGHMKTMEQELPVFRKLVKNALNL